MTRLFYSPERSAPGSSDFDPVREGAAYRLAPEVALAIGERACAEATDSAGRRDEALVRRRFHELATRIAARGGRLMRDVGRLTRVEMEIEGIAPDALDEPLAVRAPGRDTRVAEQARRLARLEGGSEPAVASRASELPGASAVAQAMAALGMSTVAGPSGASRARSAPAGGLPLELRLSMEALTGIAMDDVRVSYNSRLPARLHAAAVTNGREIHLGPGHDHHLPHEAWHVVQQKQGRVAATVQGRGWQVNDDRALEREADVMGARAAAYVGAPAFAMAPRPAAAPAGVYQLAPLGEVEHIRNSCYIAAILHTFTVTKSLRNLLDPAANQIAGPIAALQDLLHRAVNTVDQNALVDATWVAAIMTAMVAAGIVPDAEAQDVNGVTVALVGALQQGNAAAAQTNGRDAYTFAAWGGGGIPAALGQQGFDGDSLGNVVHLNRAPYNHDQAPTSFQFPGGTDLGPVTYHLRAVANRDVGSYDQAHFIAYANRGAPEAPEWHENDDVGPRRRPIADLANVQTDPAMLQRRRKQLNEHGVTDDVIEKSKNLSNAVAPKPIDVLGGAVMYVYEREAIDPVAAVDGGARTLTGGNPPDTSGFRGAYYQMLFDKRKGLSLETRSALLDVLEDGKGFEKEVKTLRTEMAQAIAAELESAIYGKDTPHAKLDKLAAEHQKKYESDLKRPRKVFEQSGNDRRTMRHILSGSLMWTEQSKLYPGEEATELEAARSELDVDEKTPSGHVLKRHRVATQEACDHAESQLLRTQLWLELTRRVIQMVVAEGEGHGTLDDRTLQLLLNRSNCEGCAGRLIAEAIRIWTQLGLACVEPIADWRQVRDRFRGELRLIVSFSGNYHQDDLPRFQELCLGLTDAGWIVNLLPRNRTTDELTRKTTATLGAIDKMISSRSDKADELRRYFMISEKLRLTTGAQVPEPSSSKVETHDQEMHDESIEPIGEQVEDAKVEDAKVEDAKVEDAKVEDAKVEDAKGKAPEDGKGEDAKVERDRFGLPGGRLRKPDAS